MKVFVAWVIENVAIKETFKITSNLSVTDKVYQRLATIIGVYASGDAVRKALDKEREDIVKMYGAKALDDENTEDKHTFYTFGCGFYKVEGQEEGSKEGEKLENDRRGIPGIQEEDEKAE